MTVRVAVTVRVWVAVWVTVAVRVGVGVTVGTLVMVGVLLGVEVGVKVGSGPVEHDVPVWRRTLLARSTIDSEKLPAFIEEILYGSQDTVL